MPASIQYHETKPTGDDVPRGFAPVAAMAGSGVLGYITRDACQHKALDPQTSDCAHCGQHVTMAL